MEWISVLSPSCAIDLSFHQPLVMVTHPKGKRLLYPFIRSSTLLAGRWHLVKGDFIISKYARSMHRKLLVYTIRYHGEMNDWIFDRVSPVYNFSVIQEKVISKYLGTLTYQVEIPVINPGRKRVFRLSTYCVKQI